MRLRRKELLAIIALAAGTYLVIFTHFRVNRSALKVPDKRQVLTALPAHDRNPHSNQFRSFLKDPDPKLHGALLVAYYYSIPVEEFPATFAALVSELGRQRSIRYEELLRIWSERDPHGAWEAVRPMFDFIAPDRFTDSWQRDPLIPPSDPAKLASSKFWPTPALLHNFVEGLFRSSISEEAKTTLYQDYYLLFDRDDNGRPPEPIISILAPSNHYAPSLLQDWKFALQIKTAPVEELNLLVDQAFDTWKFDAFSLGLCRLVKSDPSFALEAIDRMTDLQFAIASDQAESQIDPETLRALRDSLVGPALAQLLNSWATHQPVEAWEWIETNHLDAAQDFAADGLFNFINLAQQQELLKTAADTETFDDDRALMSAWAKTDLEAALRYAEMSLPVYEYSDFAEKLFYDAIYADSPKSNLFQIYEKAAMGIKSENLGVILEEWGEIDTGHAARFGVKWLLSSDEYKREDVIKPWGGDRDAEIRDGYVDDRTFGCLRCWALSQPDQMQSWINTQQDPEVREALQWLKDHPNGK